MLYLGVDGGNTKTIALVCGGDGRIAGHARTGNSDVYSAVPGTPIEEIVRGATAAIAEAGGGEVACAYFSLAGADWPVDIAWYEEELARHIPARRTIVVNDAIGAIRCGPADGVGCSFVCGTGTALGARAADGRHWHVNWLAAPYFTIDLTRATLDAAVRSELGLMPPSYLAGARRRGLRRRRCRRRDGARHRARAAPRARSSAGLLLEAWPRRATSSRASGSAGSPARTPRTSVPGLSPAVSVSPRRSRWPAA